MTSITVFEDQENVTHQNGKGNIGIPRVVPKPFLHDNAHQATPRKALGDVRNIQVQRQTSSVKHVLQSDRNFPVSASKSSKSAIWKPPGTSKKTTRNTIKVLGDEKTERVSSKKDCKTDLMEACSLQGQNQKENSFPFLEEGFKFVVPDYLKILSDYHVSENIWLPSHVPQTKRECRKEIDFNFLTTDIEKFPGHLEWEVDTHLNNMATEVLDVSNDPEFSVHATEKICELGEIEGDLAEIDACFSFPNYEDIIKRLDAMELCYSTDSGEDDGLSVPGNSSGFTERREMHNKKT